MTHPEHSVLSAIAELEAEENPDDITELVRWQLEQGAARERQRDRDYWAPPYRANPLGELARPEPSGPMRVPSGQWWRCDSPADLWVEVERTVDVSGLIEWKIVVEHETVAEYRYYRWDDPSNVVEYEVDQELRKPLWIAILCEAPPSAGEWYHWERAALVPVSG